MSHYHSKTREFTNKILEAIEEGMLDKDMVIMACLKYMSEDQVKDMAEANCFFEHEDEEDEEEEEWTPDNADFNDKGSRHHY
jgi:hypothetical protein